MTASKSATDANQGGTDFFLFPNAASAVMLTGPAPDSSAFSGPLPAHVQDTRDTITISAIPAAAFAFSSVNALIQDE